MRKAHLEPMHQIISLRKTDDGEVLKVTVQLPMELGWFERVRLNVIGNNSFELNSVSYDIPHAWNDDNTKFAVFETEVFLTTSALYYYYFSYECNGQYTLLKKANVSGNVSITKQECFKMSINFRAPDWARGAVMYHIFVDRFYKDPLRKVKPIEGRTFNQWYEKPVLGPNANGDWNVDFYGGNLLGIIDKLDYIQSLGVSIIYLSPILRGQSNHLYDTIDYELVDPYLGTNDDLTKLCTEAHKRGMYIVLDGVYNHTGNRSRYFDQFGEYGNQGAYNNSDSPYSVFYRKTWHNGKVSYSFWWGQLNLPECDTNAPEWQDYITGVGGIIDMLMSCGIDGLRLDVADELSDPMIQKILEAIIRNKPDGFLFGEVWKNPMRMNRGYISSGKGMHSVMNYFLADALIRYYKYRDTWKLERVVREILTEYPTDTLLTLMNFTSTHDISRAIELFACNVFNPNKEWAWDMDCDNASDFIKAHNLSDDAYAYGKLVLKSYVVALAFFPGIFSIFYGDEVGLQGLHNLANRASYPWGHEDMELLRYFRNMIKVRNDYPFLKYAECHVKEISANHFSYERTSDDETILVVVSRTHHWSDIHIPDDFKIIFRSSDNCTEAKLDPYGAIVLKKFV